MNRVGSALGWSVLGLIAGAIIGALAGFVMGIVRIENVAQAALAGALPVGLIGALGAFFGRLLEKSGEETGGATAVTVFVGALLGALLGTIIGVALGADVWLLTSIAGLENDGIVNFFLYYFDLVGGPHVIVGAFLGILTVGFVDVFFGDASTMNVLTIAALLTPIVALISALIGQIDWGTAFVIVVSTAVVFYILVKSGGGATTASQNGAAKGKGKVKA
jgi:hypothetical protein